MRKVGPKDSLAEITLRKKLHAEGYRFRLHSKKLPGTPDIVFPRLKKILFVHGCFWHGHRCRAGANRPKTNLQYWNKKLEKTKLRDESNQQRLKQLGWRYLVVWECEIADPQRFDEVIDFLSRPPAEGSPN